MRRSFFTAAAAMFVVSLFYCAPLNYNDGNGSGVGNGKITGVLYNSDGSRAKNAAIKAIPANYNPLGGLNKSSSYPEIKSTITDDTGGFSFDSLPEQTFNIFGSDNINKAFIDSVRIDKKMPTILAPDTLRAPGAINGIVRLMPEHDSRSVVVMVIGTTVWTAPEDSIGNFRLQDMAKGRYRVRFLSAQQGYQSLDTQVTINTGSEDFLPDTLRLAYSGIPVPSGLRTQYDTLMQIVTVWWNKADSNLVNGYTLYRRNVDSNVMPSIIHKGSVTDTMYQDSTAVQDMSYEYWVTAVNGRNEEGAKSLSATVTIAGVFSVVDSIVKGSGPQQGQFGYLSRIAFDSAHNMYITDTKNNRLQKFDSLGNLVFADDSFSMPMGVAFIENVGVAIADFEKKRVVTTDLAGTRLDTLATSGKPFGSIYFNHKWCVLSDSGIEVYDSNGAVQACVTVSREIQFGDIESFDSGIVLVLIDDEVFRFNPLDNTLSVIVQLHDKYNNQNGRIVSYGPDTFLLMTNDKDGPFYANIYVYNVTGRIVARWKDNRRIHDMYSMKDGSITGVTDGGAILRLKPVYSIK